MRKRFKNWFSQITAWALSFTVCEQIGPASMISVLFVSLGATPLQIGILVATLPIGTLLQAVIAPIFERKKSRKLNALVITAISAAPYILIAALTFLVAEAYPGLAIFGILIIFAFASPILALREILFFDLAGSTVENTEYGRFFGLRDTATALATIGAGALIFVTLTVFKNDFPLGYIVLFACSSVFVMLSCAALLLSSDCTKKTVFAENKGSSITLLTELPLLLREDESLRYYLVWRTLIQTSRCSHPFLLIFIIQRFALEDQVAGMLLMAAGICRFATGTFCGWITDRWGPRKAASVVALLSVSVSAAALITETFSVHVIAGYVIFGLWGIFKAMWFSADSALVLTLTSGEKHLRYISLARIMPMIVTLFMPLIIGYLVSSYGYWLAFLLATLPGVGALVISLPMQRIAITVKHSELPA